MARRKKRADGRLQKSFRVEIKGVKKQYFVYGHTEKELLENEIAKRQEIEQKIETHCNPTISEYYDKWMEDRRGTVSEATLRCQDKVFGIIKNIKLEPLDNILFGELKMKNVDTDILRSVQKALKKGRKSRTVNDYMALINHMFSDAYNDMIIPYNPCKAVKKLKQTEEKARDTHHRALSLSEQKAFFESERCKNSYYYNVFRFAINTGMRVGEIGALKYSDISNDIIHVERTITRTETGSYIVGDNAKTEAGRRTIPMNNQIKEIVSSQKQINQQLDGNIISMNSLLFKAVERGLLLPTPIDREIKRICNEIGIEHFTMHAFRATFATRAIENGMNPKTLQEILGHSNFNITMSLYGHCLNETKIQEMNALTIAI